VGGKEEGYTNLPASLEIAGGKGTLVVGELTFKVVGVAEREVDTPHGLTKVVDLHLDRPVPATQLRQLFDAQKAADAARETRKANPREARPAATATTPTSAVTVTTESGDVGEIPFGD
jgi:hypothetical protein